MLALVFGFTLSAAMVGCDDTSDAAGINPPASTNTEAVARGKTVYMSVCIACHGEHGEARPGLGKDLGHSEFLNGLTDEQAVAFLMQGRSPSDPLNTTGVQMPPKGGNPALTTDDLKDVIAFVRTLRAN